MGSVLFCLKNRVYDCGSERIGFVENSPKGPCMNIPPLFRMTAVIAFFFAHVVCCFGQQVTFPSQAASSAFRNARLLYVPDGQPTPDNLQKAFLMKWIVQAYKQNPYQNPVRLEEAYNKIRSEYTAQTGLELGMVLPEEGRVTAISILKKIGGQIFPEYGIALDIMDSAESAGTVSLNRTDSFLRMHLAFQANNAELVTISKELDELCVNNNLAAIIRERVFGITRYADSADLFQFTPEFRNNPTLQTLMTHTNAQDGITISVAELRALFQAELAKVNGSSSNILAAIGTLTTNQGVLLGYMTNISQQLTNQAENARIAADHQKVVDAANSSVYILSTLVGFNDPKLGHEMQVVGGSAIQIADALGKFTKGDGLQNVILSGNILSAAMNVVSIFGNSGPSPDQMILQELGVIKQMLGQIRTEMHERFDRVDRSLNVIYETLNNRFDQIDLQLGILRGDVTEIQQALYGLQVDLYRIERGVYAFLDATSRRDLAEQINLIVDYHNTYQQLLPSDRFITAENKFQTWATINARDEASSGSLGRSYEDSAVFAELTSRPLEENLNWLNEFVSTKFSPLGSRIFTSVRLANPHDWSVAANAYLELASESPLSFRATSFGRLEQIRQVGVDLNNAATKITLMSGSSGPVANHALFAALIDYYRSKAVLFKEALSAQERDFRLSISGEPAKQTALGSLDLWSGTTQATSWRPPLESLLPYTNGQLHLVTNALPVPVGWSELVPQVCFLSDLLGVAPLSLGWGEFDFAPRSTVARIDPDRPLRSVTGDVGSLKLSLAVRNGENLLLLFDYNDSLSFPSDVTVSEHGYGYKFSNPWLVPNCPLTLQIRDASTGNIVTTVTYANVWTWEQMLDIIWNGGNILRKSINDFFNLHVIVPAGLKTFNATTAFTLRADLDSGPVDMLTSRLTSRLHELQRSHYNYLLDNLRSATTLQARASELSGAKALLESFIALGFSQSLEGDDILRSLLYATERIVDTDVVNELCDLGIARSYDTNQNAKVDIAAILDERINGLERWITNRLAEIDQTKRGEPLLPITITLNRISQFQAVQRVSAPPPYAYALSVPQAGLPNQNLFRVGAEPNAPFWVQTSTDLVSWLNTTNSVFDGAVFSDSTTASRKFYRLILQP